MFFRLWFCHNVRFVQVTLLSYTPVGSEYSFPFVILFRIRNKLVVAFHCYHQHDKLYFFHFFLFYTTGRISSVRVVFLRFSS